MYPNLRTHVRKLKLRHLLPLRYTLLTFPLLVVVPWKQLSPDSLSHLLILKRLLLLPNRPDL